MTEGARAFYAREGGVASDLISVVHLPYTAWHLSYVVMGAAFAPQIDWTRFSGTLVAFFGGTGLAAHALDEWNGRPLRTTLRDQTLFLIAALGFILVACAVAAGVWLFSWWVLAWAVVGGLLAVTYSLEWFGGVLHSDLGFALVWGAFPIIVGYWVQADSLSVAVVGLAIVAELLSLVQRSLSTSARFVRRRATRSEATFDLDDGVVEWDQHELLRSWETPLTLMSVAMVLLAVSMLLLRLT